jgi:predicted  nucleic acid-binding Zn-ribbon protein
MENSGRIQEIGVELEFSRAELAGLREELSDLRDDLGRFELDVDDYESEYNESLDEAGPVTVAGMEYDPSHVLKQVDPITWRCMLVDYVDSLDVEDSEEYQAIEEKIEAIEEEIEELKEEIEELEGELSELESDSGE